MLFEVVFLGLMTIYIHVSNWLNIYDIMFVLSGSCNSCSQRSAKISMVSCTLIILPYFVSFSFPNSASPSPSPSPLVHSLSRARARTKGEGEGEGEGEEAEGEGGGESGEDRRLIGIAGKPRRAEEARRIGTALVERRLAACVQIVGPVESVYRWQGKIESAQEWLLIVKTTASISMIVRDRIKELHSYELPEAIEIPISAGSDEYLDWIDEVVDQR